MTAHRPFAVRARDDHSHHPHLMTQASFEAAAIAYVEDHLAEALDGTSLSIVVRDVESGREHCFRIDLETGDAAPCARE